VATKLEVLSKQLEKIERSLASGRYSGGTPDKGIQDISINNKQ
jgi:hypothetical protein